jgi:hypothetical protein
VKNFTTALKLVMLGCILFSVIQGSSSGEINAGKGNPRKKPLVSGQDKQPSLSFKSAIERQLIYIEKNIVSSAEAMPEDKFYFTPESLGIKSSEFKGVRYR